MQLTAKRAAQMVANSICATADFKESAANIERAIIDACKRSRYSVAVREGHGSISAEKAVAILELLLSRGFHALIIFERKEAVGWSIDWRPLSTVRQGQ